MSNMSKVLTVASWLFLGLLFAELCVACTENQAARSFGGTMTVDLPCGEKLVDITWKDQDFWYATRPMRDGEYAEVTTFREKKDGMSLYANGKVVVKECDK